MSQLRPLSLIAIVAWSLVVCLGVSAQAAGNRDQAGNRDNAAYIEQPGAPNPNAATQVQQGLGNNALTCLGLSLAACADGGATYGPYPPYDDGYYNENFLFDGGDFRDRDDFRFHHHDRDFNHDAGGMHRMGRGGGFSHGVFMGRSGGHGGGHR